MDSKLYSKAEILVDVHRRYSDDPDWKDFFYYNDVGVYLAYTVHYDFGELNDNGIRWINRAWLALCRIIMVDSDEEYDFFDDMLAIGVVDE